MFLYLLTSPTWKSKWICKLGCTSNPHQRIQDFYTSHPPTEEYEITFEYLWMTNAKEQSHLLHYESQLHQQFAEYRLSRQRFGDSEFFQFPDEHAYNMVQQFLEQQKYAWGIQRVSILDILPIDTMDIPYQQNPNFISNDVDRMEMLEKTQLPVFRKIFEFLEDPFSDNAGIVIAPCGSGKTVMTAKSIKKSSFSKIIICCPSNIIQRQWRTTLENYETFRFNEILLVGGDGNSFNPFEIDRIMQLPKYCIITTYMSSSLLVNYINQFNADLIVFDESHHMAGMIGEESGKGKTRCFLNKVISLHIKRLFLTYTPRYILNDYNATTFSMDDEEIFGKTIVDVNYRQLIDDGILPDFRVWRLNDPENLGQGIEAIAKCILTAWEQKEIVRGVEQYIFHHLIVFAKTQWDVHALEQFFNTALMSKTTHISHLKDGDDVKLKITEYERAPRAILINCKILNEGVDIPITNAVSIVYPKQACGEIIQMLLRGGRWYPGKSIFHILIPTLNNVEKFEITKNILIALSKCDSQLCDFIKARQCINESLNTSTNPLKKANEIPVFPLTIQVNSCSSNPIELDQLFTDIFNQNQNNLRQIQKCCIREGITTSIEFKKRFPSVEVDGAVAMYDFLNPNREKIEFEEFKRILHANGIQSVQRYSDWQKSNTLFPCIQNIEDGYFSLDFIDMQTLFPAVKILKQSRIR
jgi:superfamily II DNA or RNA helicase